MSAKKLVDSQWIEVKDYKRKTTVYEFAIYRVAVYTWLRPKLISGHKKLGRNFVHLDVNLGTNLQVLWFIICVNILYLWASSFLHDSVSPVWIFRISSNYDFIVFFLTLKLWETHGLITELSLASSGKPMV